MSSSLTYVYALVASRPDIALRTAQGIDGGMLRVLELGALGAVASTVRAADFGEEALQASMENIDWLDRTARRHDDVVRSCHREVTTMPLRLATIYVDDDSAIRKLRDISSQVLHTLARLDGCDEWGVKLHAADAGDQEKEMPAPPSSGTDYLRRRQAALTRSTDAAASAEEVFDALRTSVVDAVRHQPQDRRLTQRAEPMVLNASFLVRRTQIGEFQAAVRAVVPEQLHNGLVVTGPWAPYSFAEVTP